jgi:hypothetical protein
LTVPMENKLPALTRRFGILKARRSEVSHHSVIVENGIVSVQKTMGNAASL